MIFARSGDQQRRVLSPFRNQAGAFLALLDGWLQTIDSAIEASKDKTAPETFMQMTEAFPYLFETAGEGLPMFLEFWLQASRDKKIWEASIAPYRRYHKYFTSLIKKGVEEGSFVEVDPELTSRMIVSTAMGLLLQSLLDPKGAKWEKVARESTNLLVNSFIEQVREIRYEAELGRGSICEIGILDNMKLNCWIRCTFSAGTPMKTK